MNLLQMSVTAGLLIIAVIIIRAVALNKLPKKMFLVLWGVAVLRLLVPVSIPLPFHVPNVFDVFVPATVEQPAPEIPADTGVTFTVIMAMSEAFGQTTEAAQPYNITQSTVMRVVWIGGMLAAFFLFAVIYYKNHRELRFATRIRGNGYLDEWLIKHKTKRPLSIWQSDRITTPIAVGIIKPRIILPLSLALDDTRLLDYVLAHEYFHIKRYDALWKILLAVALCVHWFNPLVWAMFLLANRDLELSCDEGVINRFGAETKTAYAYTLIGLAEQRRKFTPLFSGFSKNATQERIISIMKNKKASLTGLLAACFTVFALVIGAFAVSTADHIPEPSVPPVTESSVLPLPPPVAISSAPPLEFNTPRVTILESDALTPSPPELPYLQNNFINISANGEWATIRENIAIFHPDYERIRTAIENGEFQPLDIPDLPKGVKVFSYNGENIIKITVN